MNRKIQYVWVSLAMVALYEMILLVALTLKYIALNGFDLLITVLTGLLILVLNFIVQKGARESHNISQNRTTPFEKMIWRDPHDK